MGCAASAPKKYSQIFTNERASNATTLQLIKSSHEAIELKAGEPATIKVTDKDKALKLDGYYANYKLMKLRVDSPYNTTLNIRSWCDCFGGTKSVLVPEVYVFDSNFNPILSSLRGAQILNAESGKHHASLLKIWDVQLPQPDTYYFVIHSNNKNAGEKVGTLTGSDIISYGAGAGSSFNISSSLTSYPVGEFDVWVAL